MVTLQVWTAIKRPAYLRNTEISLSKASSLPLSPCRSMHLMAKYFPLSCLSSASTTSEKAPLKQKQQQNRALDDIHEIATSRTHTEQGTSETLGSSRFSTEGALDSSRFSTEGTLDSSGFSTEEALDSSGFSTEEDLDSSRFSTEEALDSSGFSTQGTLGSSGF